MTTTRRLYVATNNAHKQQELKALLGEAFDVRLAKELKPGLDWDETGATFADNARIKARTVKEHAPDACVLADDSGLEVDALGGAPGVHSARYAGEQGDDQANNAKLLRELGGVPAAKRKARFVCVLCFIDEKGQETLFRGTCEGAIVEEARGAKGFGYDPLFLVENSGGRTMAELGEAEKNKVSHRGHAVAAWKAALT